MKTLDVVTRNVAHQAQRLYMSHYELCKGLYSQVTLIITTINHKQFLTTITPGHEPSRFSKAQEIDVLGRNDTWTLATLPPRKKAIGCKLVYKIKYNSYGSVEHHKARLIVQGDNEKEGVNYNETLD
ncbi:putative mitochondrial protein, partial [Mucuna pruriens]